MKEMDNKKMQDILTFVSTYVSSNGYSPSYREISVATHTPSTATIKLYLDKLEERGMIRRSPNRNRTLEILAKEYKPLPQNTVNIPLVGKITAGIPIEAVENIDDFYAFPAGLFARGDLIMLTVSGDSMIDAGIEDGDKIIIKRQPTAENGQIVAAMIDGDATVKRFYRGKDHYILHAENKAYEDILTKHLDIIGILVGLVRTY